MLSQLGVQVAGAGFSPVPYELHVSTILCMHTLKLDPDECTHVQPSTQT